MLFDVSVRLLCTSIILWVKSTKKKKIGALGHSKGICESRAVGK